MLFPIVIDHNRFQLIVVGPLDKERDGVLIKTKNVDQDIIGFANYIYNKEDLEMSTEISVVMDFYKKKNSDKNDYVDYDYCWTNKLVSMIQDDMNRNLNYETRSKKLLFVWRIPKSNTNKEDYKEVRDIFKSLLLSASKEINNLINEALYLENGRNDKELKQDLIHLIEWHISLPIFMSKFF